MRILVIHNTQNTHGNDAQGAFVPEAINFEKHREALGDEVVRVGYDNLLPKAARTAAFLGRIASAEPFHAFVYLGHGLRNSLPSPNIAGADRLKLARLLAEKALDKHRLFVTLFACSTGETTTKQSDGEGGFADRLRDDLVALGITGGWVDGHTVAAHATQNPFLRRFNITEAEKDGGGDWVIDPKSPEWPVWKKRLNAKWRDDPFRFDMPYMTIPEIRAACAARKEA